MFRLLLTLCLIVSFSSAWAREVVDLAGRTVVIPAKVERIVLGEGRYIAALAILDREDPLRRVVATMGEFPLLDPGGHAQWLARFPRLADIPLVGKASPDSFSVERAIALAPDLAIFGLAGHGPGPQATEMIRQLEAAGTTVVFIDFFLDPLTNTPRSLDLLGKVLGREREAADFVAAYDAASRRVGDRLARVATRPLVFLENRVGLQEDCCASVGEGVIGRVIEQAGGRNLAARKIAGHSGTISLEYLLSNQPDIYVGTAIGNADTVVKAPRRIAMGPGVGAEQARATLARSLERPGIADLAAVKAGRAYALWHHFFHSPFNVVALQVLAKWFHPELFADLDPAATHRDLVARFQPVALDGAYWAAPR